MLALSKEKFKSALDVVLYSGYMGVKESLGQFGRTG